MNELVIDPWLAAELARALAPYAGRLSDEQLAWMREQLLETLREERGAAELLARARPRTDVDESGERVRDVEAPKTKASLRRGKAR